MPPPRPARERPYGGVSPPVPFWVGWWAQRIVESWHPDVVILAIGTNDVNHGDSALDIVSAMIDLVVQLEAAGVGRVYVATVPPWFAPAPVDMNLAIADLNAFVRFAFGTRVIDFHEGFDRDDFGPDGIHLTVAGHQKRAAIAAAMLERDCGAVTARTAGTFPRPCRYLWTGPCTSGATCTICERQPASRRCARRLRTGRCRCTPGPSVAVVPGLIDAGRSAPYSNGRGGHHGQKSGRSEDGRIGNFAGRFSRNAETPSIASGFRPIQ